MAGALLERSTTPLPGGELDGERAGEPGAAAPAAGGAGARPRGAGNWARGEVETALPGSGAGTTLGMDDVPTFLEVARRDGPQQFAHFEVLERIAGGGMGVVFRARDTLRGGEVALKVMRGGALGSPVCRRRFVREAETAAALDHPGVVRVHELGEWMGFPYFAMELIDGLTIHHHVAMIDAGPREVVELIRGAAEVLEHCHARGVVHRDVKPENLLVGPDGRPRLIDFGIAKLCGGADEAEGDQTAWTEDGDVLGTPAYMSPEQADGRTADVDPRSDVYSLGAVLYRLLAGRVPFSGRSRSGLLQAIRLEDPEPLARLNAEVDPELEAIVSRAMAKEPELRYQRAGDLAADLQRWLSGGRVTAPVMNPGRRLVRLLRRRHHHLLAVATCLVALVVMSVLLATVLERRLRTERASELLARAREAPLPERLALARGALWIDPGHREARALLERARRELGRKRPAPAQEVSHEALCEVLAEQRDLLRGRGLAALARRMAVRGQGRAHLEAAASARSLARVTPD